MRVHGNSSSVEQFVLRDIADILSSMGKDFRNYDLPTMHQSSKTIYQFYLVPCILINVVYCIKFILDYTSTDN